MAYLFFYFRAVYPFFRGTRYVLQTAFIVNCRSEFLILKKPVKTNLAFISVTVTNIFHPEPFSASSLVFVDPPPKEKKSRKSTSHIE